MYLLVRIYKQGIGFISSIGSSLTVYKTADNYTGIKSTSSFLQSPPPSAHSEVKVEHMTADGVLDFSTKETRGDASRASSSASLSPYSVEAPSSHDTQHQHVRKASHPLKRPWQPTPGYGGTLIGKSTFHCSQTCVVF